VRSWVTASSAPSTEGSGDTRYTVKKDNDIPVRAGAGGGAGTRLLRHRQQGTLATPGTLLKKGDDFPISSQDVTNRTLPGGGIIKLFPARESSVSGIPAGDGKIVILFLQCIFTYHFSCRIFT
jgi:hypothetical protein